MLDVSHKACTDWFFTTNYCMLSNVSHYITLAWSVNKEIDLSHDCQFRPRAINDKCGYQDHGLSLLDKCHLLGQSDIHYVGQRRSIKAIDSHQTVQIQRNRKTFEVVARRMYTGC